MTTFVVFSPQGALTGIEAPRIAGMSRGSTEKRFGSVLLTILSSRKICSGRFSGGDGGIDGDPNKLAARSLQFPPLFIKAEQRHGL